jgi:3-hydroxybutyryl-CoA dehydrogenase
VIERLLRDHSFEDAFRLLQVVSTLEDCVKDIDLAIETVTESVEIKRRVFAEIDRAADQRVLIGTNTSSIPGSRLADATRRPEKVFNFNWGHVGHAKVEIMPHPGTAPATMDAAEDFIRALGLVPIRDRVEILGYGSNRIWRAVKKEVLHVIDAGVLTAQDVDRAWMLDWDVPIGPCGLMDRIGLDVVRDIEMIFYRATGDPSDRPPAFLSKMIETGALGVKSGAGFYDYPNPAYRQDGFLEGRSP